MTLKCVPQTDFPRHYELNVRLFIANKLPANNTQAEKHTHTHGTNKWQEGKNACIRRSLMFTYQLSNYKANCLGVHVGTFERMERVNCLGGN